MKVGIIFFLLTTSLVFGNLSPSSDDGKAKKAPQNLFGTKRSVRRGSTSVTQTNAENDNLRQLRMAKAKVLGRRLVSENSGTTLPLRMKITTDVKVNKPLKEEESRPKLSIQKSPLIGKSENRNYKQTPSSDSKTRNSTETPKIRQNTSGRISVRKTIRKKILQNLPGNAIRKIQLNDRNIQLPLQTNTSRNRPTHGDKNVSPIRSLHLLRKYINTTSSHDSVGLVSEKLAKDRNYSTFNVQHSRTQNRRKVLQKSFPALSKTTSHGNIPVDPAKVIANVRKGKAKHISATDLRKMFPSLKNNTTILNTKTSLGNNEDKKQNLAGLHNFHETLRNNRKAIEALQRRVFQNVELFSSKEDDGPELPLMQAASRKQLLFVKDPKDPRGRVILFDAKDQDNLPEIFQDNDSSEETSMLLKILRRSQLSKNKDVTKNVGTVISKIDTTNIRPEVIGKLLRSGINSPEHQFNAPSSFAMLNEKDSDESQLNRGIINLMSGTRKYTVEHESDEIVTHLQPVAGDQVISLDGFLPLTSSDSHESEEIVVKLVSPQPKTIPVMFETSYKTNDDDKDGTTVIRLTPELRTPVLHMFNNPSSELHSGEKKLRGSDYFVRIDASGEGSNSRETSFAIGTTFKASRSKMKSAKNNVEPTMILQLNPSVQRTLSGTSVPVRKDYNDENVRPHDSWESHSHEVNRETQAGRSTGGVTPTSPDDKTIREKSKYSFTRPDGTVVAVSYKSSFTPGTGASSNINTGGAFRNSGQIGATGQPNVGRPISSSGSSSLAYKNLINPTNPNFVSPSTQNSATFNQIPSFSQSSGFTPYSNSGYNANSNFPYDFSDQLNLPLDTSSFPIETSHAYSVAAGEGLVYGDQLNVNLPLDTSALFASSSFPIPQKNPTSIQTLSSGVVPANIPPNIRNSASQPSSLPPTSRGNSVNQPSFHPPTSYGNSASTGQSSILDATLPKGSLIRSHLLSASLLPQPPPPLLVRRPSVQKSNHVGPQPPRNAPPRNTPPRNAPPRNVPPRNALNQPGNVIRTTLRPNSLNRGSYSDTDVFEITAPRGAFAPGAVFQVDIPNRQAPGNVLSPQGIPQFGPNLASYHRPQFAYNTARQDISAVGQNLLSQGISQVGQTLGGQGISAVGQNLLSQGISQVGQTLGGQGISAVGQNLLSQGVSQVGQRLAGQGLAQVGQNLASQVVGQSNRFGPVTLPTRGNAHFDDFFSPGPIVDSIIDELGTFEKGITTFMLSMAAGQSREYGRPSSLRDTTPIVVNAPLIFTPSLRRFAGMLSEIFLK